MASLSGTYTISYSLGSEQYAGTYNDVFLHLNGQRVEESRHYSYNWNSGNVHSLGARYSTVQYSIVQYSTVQYSTVQYSREHYIAGLCI